MRFRTSWLTRLGLVVAMSPCAMQIALAQSEQAGEIEEIVVTGTRLKDPNVVSSSQITTVEMEDISDRGITRVEDYLNDLPPKCPASGGHSIWQLKMAHF